MFKDVFKIVRKYSKTKKPLWIQCWLNYHYEKKLNIISDWHCHPDSLFHGYIAIEPQDTKTVFENYTIENKIGNVYIGLAENKHKVITNSPYSKGRITIAFDVVDEEKIKDWSIDRIINLFGDGILSDNSECSNEYRKYLTSRPIETLERHINECVKKIKNTVKNE